MWWHCKPAGRAATGTRRGWGREGGRAARSMRAGSVSAAAIAGGAARCRTTRHRARARARGLAPPSARPPPARHALQDMDALSDDDEFARREPQVRVARSPRPVGPGSARPAHLPTSPAPSAADMRAQQVVCAQGGCELACKDDLEPSSRRAVSPRVPADDNQTTFQNTINSIS